MHSLSWKKQAQADLISIVRHIAKDNPDAAEKLVEKIEEQTELLRENPLLFRIGRKRGTRELIAAGYVNPLKSGGIERKF